MDCGGALLPFRVVVCDWPIVGDDVEFDGEFTPFLVGLWDCNLVGKLDGTGLLDGDFDVEGVGVFRVFVGGNVLGNVGVGFFVTNIAVIG